jgi:hypothetical protein
MSTPKPKNRAILNATQVETKGAETLNAERSTPNAQVQQPPAVVTVRVKRQPINEGGVHYSAGDTFETTPTRAAALAALCDIVVGENTETLEN